MSHNPSRCSAFRYCTARHCTVPPVSHSAQCCGVARRCSSSAQCTTALRGASYPSAVPRGVARCSVSQHRALQRCMMLHGVAWCCTRRSVPAVPHIPAQCPSTTLHSAPQHCMMLHGIACCCTRCSIPAVPHIPALRPTTLHSAPSPCTVHCRAAQCTVALHHAAWHCMMLHKAQCPSTAPHTAALHPTLQHSAPHCSTAPHTTALYPTLQHSTPHPSTAPHTAAQRPAALHDAVLTPCAAGADGALRLAVQREGADGDVHEPHQIQPGGAVGYGHGRPAQLHVRVQREAQRAAAQRRGAGAVHRRRVGVGRWVPRRSRAGGGGAPGAVSPPR